METISTPCAEVLKSTSQRVTAWDLVCVMGDGVLTLCPPLYKGC